MKKPIRKNKNIDKKDISPHIVIKSIILITIILSIALTYYVLLPIYKLSKFECDTEDCYEENTDYFKEALINSDEALCDKIEDIRLRKECQDRFRPPEDKVCDEQCNDINKVKTAIIENNQELCTNVEDEKIKSQCIEILNPKEKICDSVCMNLTFFKKALINNDKTLCSEITDEVIKNECKNIFSE